MTSENEKVAHDKEIKKKKKAAETINSLNYQFKLWVTKRSCNEQYILKYLKS